MTEPIPPLLDQGRKPGPSLVERCHSEIPIDLVPDNRDHLVPRGLQLRQDRIPLILPHDPIRHIVYT